MFIGQDLIFVFLILLSSFQIIDLVPRLAHLFFQEKLPVTLSHVQAAVLLYIGMLGQDISGIQVFFSPCSLNNFAQKTFRVQCFTFLSICFLIFLSIAQLNSHITGTNEVGNQPHTDTVQKDYEKIMRLFIQNFFQGD